MSAKVINSRISGVVARMTPLPAPLASKLSLKAQPGIRVRHPSSFGPIEVNVRAMALKVDEGASSSIPAPTTRPVVGFMGIAAKFLHDALLLVQRLFELLQRVRVAAAALQISVDSSRTAPAADSNQQVAMTSMPFPLQLLSAATLGAVTHLRQTLTDATSTLDVKLRAMESTVGEGVGRLFSATCASAEAQGGPRAVEQLHNAAVVEQEEALRQQVFAQVFAELNDQARRGSHNIGYSAA